MSDKDIRDELQKDTWTEEDITVSFEYAAHPEQLKHFSLQRLLRSEVRASSFVIIFLIAIALAALPLVYPQNDYPTYTVTLPESPENKKLTFVYGAQEALSRPDFFNKVKTEFIESKGTFIEADLTQMIARVYKEGVVVVEVPIKTKGRAGSWWETPAGIYKIETKEKTHYSTMGHVTQPWSMQFQGNFYIHGVPYYDDGTRVSSTFSGGCIRLEDEDTKKIFDAVTVGTPILVYEKDFSPDTFLYTEAQPTIDAESFMFADINNNFVFLTKNDTRPVRPGSITKLMTALVATEYINIEKTTRVTSDALVKTPIPRLEVGMTIDIYQLLFPLLQESSNEAAETIAASYGRSLFIKHMNEKAKSIGMTHTLFADPTGVSDRNTSTAEDMFMLAKYIYNNRSFIFNITSGKVRTDTYGKSIFTNLQKGNSLASNPNFFGGIADEKDTTLQNNLTVLHSKNGTTTRPLFFVSIGSNNSQKDIEGGLEYILRKYK